jgi:hypothetical protein
MVMSKLKAEKREKLPKSKFALPDERKYSVEGKANTRNAKACAAQQEKAGYFPPPTERRATRRPTGCSARADHITRSDHSNRVDAFRRAAGWRA